jgi:hypothetical protein
MCEVADGTGVTGLTAGGVAEEVVRDLFFLRSASRLSVSLLDRSKPLIHYPIFIPQQETSRISLYKLRLPLHACDHYSCYARSFFNLCPTRQQH